MMKSRQATINVDSAMAEDKSGCCRLCLRQKALRLSHILPEYLYKPLYDRKHRGLQVHAAHFGRARELQKGLRDRLFCDDCERLLNDGYEKYFLATWIRGNRLPRDIRLRQIYWIRGLDYARFKLFHLSVLFRASLSRHHAFHQVELGLHEEPLRLMLLNGDPSTPDRYLIWGYMLIDGSGRLMDQLIIQPTSTTVDGHRVYGFVFGGCVWHYFVSDSSAQAYTTVALTQDGDLPMVAKRWEGSPPVQSFIGNVIREQMS